MRLLPQSPKSRFPIFPRWLAAVSLGLGMVATASVTIPPTLATPASALSLAETSSCRDVTDSVVRLYSAYFLRAPDDQGFAYWADQWGSGSWDLPAISEFFAGSDEFTVLYGGLSDSAFLQLVYANVLGRGPDAVGKNYWVGRLGSGMTRGRLMLEFSDGDEYVSITGTSNPRFLASGERFGCLATPIAQVRARNVLANATTVAPSRERAYDRSSFKGNGYADEDRDCINARHEVLIEESTIPVTMTSSGCSVASGRWVDPYDLSVYTLASQVSIDHFVPLAHAHRAGAWRWDNTTKEAFYSDLGLAASLVVTGRNTNSAKGDRGPDQWRPPATHTWCSYAVDWIDVKTRWQLGFNQNESDALAEMLDTCGSAAATDRPLPPPTARISFAGPTTPLPNPLTPTTTTAVPVTAVPVTAVPPSQARIELTSCLRRDEVVAITNKGTVLAYLTGYRLVDEGANHSFTLSGVTLAPGQSIHVISGRDPVASSGEIVGWENNVWNNKGDTANLFDPSDKLIDQLTCTS